jgi:hypothetical protein
MVVSRAGGDGEQDEVVVDRRTVGSESMYSHDVACTKLALSFRLQGNIFISSQCHHLASDVLHCYDKL